MSLSFGQKKQKTSSSQQVEPWAPVRPYLTELLGNLDTVSGNFGPTGEQSDALASLKKKVGGGNPFSDQIGGLVSDLFGVESRSGQVGDAFTQLQEQLAGFTGATGPSDETRALIDMVAGDAQDRINRYYAGAGRDLSPSNARAAARGVAQVTAPILVADQDRRINVANQLFGAATGAAGQQQQMDLSALAARAGGVDASQAALSADQYAERELLDLAQAEKQMPVDDLSRIAQLLFGAAGLGSTSTGTSTGKSSQFGTSANLGGAIGSLFG